MKVITLTKDDSIINDLLTEIREVNSHTDKLRFSSNIELLGTLLAYEASKYFEYQISNIRTPYHLCQVKEGKNNIVLYTILRAGIAMQNGVHRIFHNSECAYFAAKHVHSSKPQLMYIDAPILDGKYLILSDPLIATGKSISFALESIKRFGKPVQIIILSIVSTDCSIEYLSDKLPNNVIFITCQIDGFKQGQRGTIPGIGDIGDLLYGQKLKLDY